MKSHLDQVIEDVDFHDFEIQIINKRVKYPTAYVYPNQEPPLIVIEANKPSLIRYALLDLLLHEKSHLDYVNYCESKGVQENVDHHSSVTFRMIEEDNKAHIERLISEEHD